MEKRNRSLLALVAYCFTATLATSLALALLLAGATFAVGTTVNATAVEQKNLSTQTFSGIITDSRCGARHLQNSDKTPAECTRSCVRHGAKYMLVDGDASYILEGNRAEFDSLAGERVRIVGTVQGDVLTVTAAAVE